MKIYAILADPTRPTDDENWVPPDQMPSEFAQLDEEERRMRRYFAIGQDDEDTRNNYCWVWLNDQIEARKGGTHGSNFGHHYADRTFKGWYDVTKDMLSFAFPSQGPGSNLPHTKEAIPPEVLNALHQEFGTTFRIMVF